MFISNILRVLSVLLFCFNVSLALTNVLFFPNPQNHDTISTFSKLAILLANTNKYTCTVILHGTDEKTFDNTDCEKLFYGLRGRETYLQKLYGAQMQFESGTFWNLQAFKETYKQQIDDFYDTEIPSKLQEMKIDILVCDVQNLLCEALLNKVSIAKVMYYDSTISSSHLMDLYEFPVSHYLASNSPFSPQISFWDKVQNHVNYYSTVITIKYQRRLFNHLLTQRDEDPNLSDNTNQAAVYITQDASGLTYPLHLPSNIIRIGCVSCLFPGIRSVNLQKFIEKRQKNILVKFSRVKDFQETQAVVEAFIEFPDIGFIIQGPIAADVETPMNVFRSEFLHTADAFDNRKLVGFISDGEYNSIIEALYYRKPMIVLGYNFGRRANGALVRDKGFGIAIMEKESVTKQIIVASIKEILNSRRRFEQNMRRYSQFIFSSDSRVETEGIFDYCKDNDIEALVVYSYHDLSFFEYRNLDNILVILLVILFLIYQIYNIISFLSCRKRKRVMINSFHLAENIDDDDQQQPEIAN